MIFSNVTILSLLLAAAAGGQNYVRVESDGQSYVVDADAVKASLEKGEVKEIPVFHQSVVSDIQPDAKKVSLMDVRSRSRVLLGYREAEVALVVHDGERNDLLYRLACALRRYGVGEAALVECLVAIDRHHSRPPLGDLRELRKIAASAAQYAPATSSEKSGQASQRTMTVVVE